MKVIGVDVGIRNCGYITCEVINLCVSILSEGEVRPNPKNTLPEKLNEIYLNLAAEISKFDPKAIVVEKLYSHHKHPTTLGVLAQVRGVVALLSHQNGLDFFEYSPTNARKSFLGKGRGNSEQVKKMAENTTGRKFISLHTADAYSLVVAFSHSQKVRNIMSQLKKTSNKNSYPRKLFSKNVLSNSRKPVQKREIPSHR